MSVTFPIQAIKLTPGSQITISHLSWPDFEQILIGVPEVWIYRNQQLKIHLLSAQGDTETVNSPTFPELSLTELITQLVQKAIDAGTSKMLRELRTEIVSVETLPATSLRGF